MTAFPQDVVADLSGENVRLQAELRAARDRQSASAEILRTIASASGDAERSLHQIAEATMRLFGAPSTTIHIAEGDGWGRTIRVGDSSKRIGAGVPEAQLRIGGRNMPGTIVAENRQVHVPDLDNVDPAIADWPGLPHARAAGTRSMCGSPLRREGKAIGALIVYRDRLAPFTDEELALQQSFADQAAIAIENSRLFNETKEALERQTATADILKVIASSPSDVQPVFEAIVSSAAKLFEPCAATITTLKDNKLHWNATAASISGFDVERTRTIYPIPFDQGSSPSSRAILERRIIEFPDVAASDTPELTQKAAAAGGFRSVTFVPLVDRDQGIGTIIFTYPQAGFRLPEKQLALVQTFADQAVIAIQNARLFNETKEALERQTATADILKVIASSPSDVQPVFEAIATSSNKLIGGFSTAVLRFIGDELHLAAFTPTNAAADQTLKTSFPRPLAEFPPFLLVRNGETVQFADTESEDVPPLNRDLARLRGYRSMLFTPLMNGGTPIGLISVTRKEPGTFAPHHVQLVRTFADQAVIAIENVRLFDEVQAKTRDLGESLQQQTATADVLKVISRSAFDLQTVLDTLVTSASTLCSADQGMLLLLGDGVLKPLSYFGPFPDKFEFRKSLAAAPHRGVISGRAVLDGHIAHVPDVLIDPEFTNNSWQQLTGFRAMLAVPLMRQGQPIGAMALSRTTPGLFTDRQIELVTTFADQAVIAIENVRLFDEVQAKTRDLSEALTYQTGSGNILRVIASSPTDVKPVLKAIVESACELCEADDALVTLKEGNDLLFQAQHGSIPVVWERQPIDRQGPSGRAVIDLTPVHVHDLLAPEGEQFPRAREFARRTNVRTVLCVPLLREGESIGVIVLRRTEVRPFSDKQITLLQTFADQAVIAIENVRLFDEVQAKTRDLEESLQHQTATSEVLQAIGSSMADAQPAFDRILDGSMKLFNCKGTAIFLAPSDGMLHLAGTRGFGSGQVDHLYPKPIIETTAAAIIGERRQQYVPDVLNGADVSPSLLRTAKTIGNFSVVMTPMLWEGRGVGMISAAREPNAGFSDKELSLLKTFADQAVIAIENARLFNEVQSRTRELSESLQQQTATAEVLKVISRSAFDLTSVLTTLVQSARELCNAPQGMFLIRDGEVYRTAMQLGYPPEFERYIIDHPIRPNPHSGAGRAAFTGQVAHFTDVLADPEYQLNEGQRLGQYRALLSIPLLREGEVIGVFSLGRTEPEPFTPRQIELVQTFADQAVIAIENVRLFDEVQVRTRDVTEALTYQTGSSNILKVIASSPTDVGPVLQAIADSACELCEAYDAIVHLRDGDYLRYRAHHGALPFGFEKLPDEGPKPFGVENLPISRDWVTGRSVVDKVPVHLHDVLSDEGADFPEAQRLSRREGTRTVLSVPMLRESESIGAIVLRRNEVHPFTDKQIALLQTFADQAVIAIGNVRLFEEVQARTRDLTESLQQQTATADVLRVISASPGELEPVFQAMLENAVRLCEAKFAMLFLYEDNQFRAVGKWNIPPAYGEFLEKNTILADPKVPLGRVALTKQPVQVEDVLLDQAYIEGFPGMVGVAEGGGARTLLQVPMLKENDLVGTIGIYRQEVRPFTDKQIALVQNFAAQAVIAIENARLLNELRQRTDDLTESLNGLRTAQDRLVQTEKLASLGQLTAGIAHEIKNPLNFVNNFAALSAELTDELNDLLKSAALSEKMQGEVNELTRLLKDNLEKVVQHGKRADSIVKNMLLHSREGSGDHRPADINALLDESLNLAYHGARAEKPEFNVTLQRDLDETAGAIELFPQEITRVFLNLISNGFYAVTKRKAENAGPGFEPLLSATTRNLGDTVEIRIRDNGTGIPPEVKDKMFNPFFTTKPAGEGTGLGLSMSHDIIVKQHGGSIDVATEPGQFTEFRIVLPRISNSSNKTRG